MLGARARGRSEENSLDSRGFGLRFIEGLMEGGTLVHVGINFDDSIHSFKTILDNENLRSIALRGLIALWRSGCSGGGSASDQESRDKGRQLALLSVNERRVEKNRSWKEKQNGEKRKSTRGIKRVGNSQFPKFPPGALRVTSDIVSPARDSLLETSVSRGHPNRLWQLQFIQLPLGQLAGVSNIHHLANPDSNSRALQLIDINVAFVFSTTAKLSSASSYVARFWIFVQTNLKESTLSDKNKQQTFATRENGGREPDGSHGSPRNFQLQDIHTQSENKYKERMCEHKNNVRDWYQKDQTSGEFGERIVNRKFGKSPPRYTQQLIYHFLHLKHTGPQRIKIRLTNPIPFSQRTKSFDPGSLQLSSFPVSQFSTARLKWLYQ
ncbi:hypothetical protein WN51_08318 [Melipona quadrifasciata]|uniref:Uncharacterized protein n=1 Tax=Melipona quadrifasciata TaxID=166423 RepID=A0A0N0BK69_9HYME|nr:hypothetical protein WN51_08318 [Melipona quadrifasciata]